MEALIWAPFCGLISVKTFQSKPQRTISSRYPDPFFLCPDTFHWSSQFFWSQPGSICQNNSDNMQLPFKITCFFQKHHISCCAGAFLFSPKHPLWSHLSCMAGECPGSQGWDFTCLESRRLWQEFISVSSHRAQALISGVISPKASVVAACPWLSPAPL